MMKLRKLKYIVVTFCAFLSSNLFSQDLFDYSHSIQFADYLYQSQQFEKASAELERLQFLYPTNDTLCLKISKSYFGAKNYTKAYNVIDKRFSSTQAIPSLLQKHYFSSALFAGNQISFDSLLNARTVSSIDEKLSYQLSHALFKADEKSYNLLASKNTITTNKLLNDYYNTFGKEINIPQKNAILAGAMSAIVPGSGRLYVGRYADAVFSLIVVGTSAYQGYRGFNKSGVKSVYGWVFSGLALGFYTGNIYGSVKAVKQYNKKQKQKIIDLAQKIYTDTM